MASFETRRSRGSAVLGLALRLTALCVLASLASAQQQPSVRGFAVERFYPSAPGGGWFVMDDLNISGGLGGAVELTSGYARKPLEVTSPDGKTRLTLVSDEAFADAGIAATYERYRVYLNFPIPFLVSGHSGMLGPFQLNAPAVSVGTNPDAVSDPRIGFDMRLWGKPGGLLRLGAGAQLIFPIGDRADYVSDGRYRGMLRFLAAGDSRAFSYAVQLGVHIRPLNDSPAPGSPNGSEFLFGGSAGRRFTVARDWTAIVGPEVFGETAFVSFFTPQQTGVEGLLTTRFERIGHGRNLRIKMALGHGLVQNFGAPQWRVLGGVELFGEFSGHGK